MLECEGGGRFGRCTAERWYHLHYSVFGRDFLRNVLGREGGNWNWNRNREGLMAMAGVVVSATQGL